jgi:uncharacterized membrane-anchored protein YhcB (DUF1043 family)
MDTNSVWELLSSISIGTVIAWITVFIAIICAICTGTIKLYNIFAKYKDVTDEDKELKHNVEEHEKQLKEIKQQLVEMTENFNKQFTDIKETLNEQNDTEITKLRHSITECGENALANKKMTVRQWTSLHEMCDRYTNKYHQNSYVKSLLDKVDRDVEIIGKLDEHGNDIE